MTLIKKLLAAWTAYCDAQKREDDYWAYKDGEVIDTNASHYEVKQ